MYIVGITWMLTSTLCNIERIASVAITSFPDPRPGCEKVSDNFLSKITAHKCGDCMFSGHTVLFVICACAWTTHSPVRRSFSRILVIFTVWTLVAAGSAIVIMNRAHYTVDVLVAWYVGIGNWYSINYLWNEHCIRKGYLKSINWPAQRLLDTDAGYQMLDSPTFDNYSSSGSDASMNEKYYQQQGSSIMNCSRASSNRNMSIGSRTSSEDNSNDLCDKAILAHYYNNGHHQRIVSTTAFTNMVASLDIEEQESYLALPPSSFNL
ncbi:PAP2 superfamily C-terminal-domain-containing protein [Phascolomyces articulosus]|uniref:PAP2 superfamily C-terminal-domain-containing protein n=1 Tax=Phascolomyces articulosus TaxID=60185 RepID=A0AAD5K3W3_9FUNG|nr:PAP2 superfamily C-terminal-domain-containing protein [Phascolomyces articulosus]